MSEMYISEAEVEQRKRDKKEKGYWICNKCGTKYYLGIACDPCMGKEFIARVKKHIAQK